MLQQLQSMINQVIQQQQMLQEQHQQLLMEVRKA
jgi:hypothetical protein